MKQHERRVEKPNPNAPAELWKGVNRDDTAIVNDAYEFLRRRACGLIGEAVAA
jgi:hypothetical protein